LSRFGRFLRLDNLPVEIVENDGIITRFLNSSRWFDPTTGRVKPLALLPRLAPEAARLETSVFRTDSLRADRIWLLGYQYVESPERRIKARASGKASLVTGQGLGFDVNGRPYPRHADIIVWPVAKDAQLMIATEIANDMTLTINPRPH
jgi:hypothetical protein